MVVASGAGNKHEAWGGVRIFPCHGSPPGSRGPRRNCGSNAAPRPSRKPEGRSRKSMHGCRRPGPARSGGQVCGTNDDLHADTCTSHSRANRTYPGSLESAIARWSPPSIDTGTTRRYDPAAAGFFYSKPLTKGILGRNYFTTLGIRTGGGERDVLVRACHCLFSTRCAWPRYSLNFTAN